MNRRAVVLLLAMAVPVGALLWLFSFFPASPMPSLPRAYADDTIITVTTDEDIDGTCPSASSCSLRTAIGMANASSAGDIVTITFSEDFAIVFDEPLLDLARTNGPTFIVGDRGTGTPRTVIDARGLTKPPVGRYSGLRITGDHWHIQGVVVMGEDADSFGVTIRGNYNELSNSYIGLDLSGSQSWPNYTGVLVTAGAHHNLIDGNWIAGNANHGVSLYGTYDAPTQITPSHHNTVTHNYIGTNPYGADLGNENKGIIIHLGSHDNYIFDNVIAYNDSYGVYLYGGADSISGLDGVYPPTGNRIVSNTVTVNHTSLFEKRGAIVSDRTHRAISNTIPTASGGFDNIIVSNLITGNFSAGIYNLGASPLISGNLILNNTFYGQGYGIYNAVSFGPLNDSPADPYTYTDDILSIPYIANNVIAGNSGVGITSIDTAPARRYELLSTLNNVVTTSPDYPNSDNMQQIWYAGVEVLTGTLTNTVPLTGDIGVHIYKGDESFRYDLGYYDEISGSVIWGRFDTVNYNDAKVWTQVNEFTIGPTGILDSWMTHTVRVDMGDVTGTVVYPFDGLTSTKPLSDFIGLPNYLVTGPFARYQIAEVNFTYDSDSDTIPDVFEGGTGTDTDGDGIPDFQDLDSDDDGIPDSVEGPEDTDGDGVPDFQDLDSDGDGIPDSVEAGDDPENPVDSDGDGIPDFQDPDSDNDGIPDSVEAGDDPEDPVDTDDDGIPDFQDPDSDDDGIPDVVEAGDDPENPVDSDDDGIPDFQDTDSDDDDIPDAVEAGQDPENPADTDGDGAPDYLDDDSDGDGILDIDEGLNDTDGDGIPDYIESNVEDPDGDGDPNYNDTDSDGDGISDDDEHYSGGDDDPFAESCSVDTDGDGIPNCQDNDVDGDGIYNYLDGDSDGDGILDSEEGAGDSDGDGLPDWLDPTDGADTSQGGDSDGDGISDVVEYYAGANDPTAFCTDTEVDTDGDGIPNCQDNDVDGDGVYNYLDLDSDGDGTPDAQEPAPPVTNDPPFDHGDVPAWIDPVYRLYLPLVTRSFA